MYSDFLNLNDVSPVLREAVEDIQLILTDRWDCEEELEDEKMVKLLENRDYLLAEVMNMQGKYAENVLVLQMAIYRLYKVHYFKETVAKGVMTRYSPHGESKNSVHKMKDGFDRWEKLFWSERYDVSSVGYVMSGGILGRQRQSITSQRKQFRRSRPLGKNNNNYYYVKETMQLALEDKETIREVMELRNKYHLLAEKSENLNAALKKVNGSEGLNMIQNMKKVIEIMERNTQGKLTPGDVLELEKYIPKWNDNMEELEMVFSKIM